MVITLWNWLLNLPVVFIQMMSWLVSPLPLLNITPLMLFSIEGITIIVGLLLTRLVLGG